MSYALFLFYLPLFLWLLTKSHLVKKTGLSIKIIAGLFLLKVFIGCAGYLLLSKVSDNSDAYGLHLAGLQEYRLLFKDPGSYFINIFQSNYNHQYGDFLGVVNSYWKDLAFNMAAKLLSIGDLFSGGNYFINEIFINYFIFFANLRMYIIFKSIYPGKTLLLIICCFLLPSFAFYTSYSLKEGLLFALLAFIIYNIYHYLNDVKNRNFLSVILTLVAIFFVCLLRAYVGIALLPAIIAWLLCYKLKWPPLLIFTGIYLLGIITFFNADKIIPSINLPQSVAERQGTFLHLPASHTIIQIDTLAPTFKSFITNLPQAVTHIVLRPFLLDYKFSVYLIPFAIEILIYQFIFLLFIFFRDRSLIISPFIIFLFFFSISALLIIGYTIPIIGAFIRYRSIYFIFLLTPMVCSTSWHKIGRVLRIV